MTGEGDEEPTAAFVPKWDDEEGDGGATGPWGAVAVQPPLEPVVEPEPSWPQSAPAAAAEPDPWPAWEQAPPVAAEPEPWPVWEPAPAAAADPEPWPVWEPAPVEEPTVQWSEPVSSGVPWPPLPEATPVPLRPGPARDETGSHALRSVAPEPVSHGGKQSRSRQRRAVPRARAVVELAVVIVLSGVALAVAIGLVVAAIAVALTRSVGG